MRAPGRRQLVIPVTTGIHKKQAAKRVLDPGFRREDDAYAFAGKTTLMRAPGRRQLVIPVTTGIQKNT